MTSIRGPSMTRARMHVCVVVYSSVSVGLYVCVCEYACMCLSNYVSCLIKHDHKEKRSEKLEFAFF